MPKYLDLPVVEWCIHFLDTCRTDELPAEFLKTRFAKKEQHLPAISKQAKSSGKPEGSISLHDLDEKFHSSISEIFLSVKKYDVMLNNMITLFSKEKFGSVSAKERNVMKVYLYLIMFELSEEAKNKIKVVLQSQILGAVKLYTMLNFLANEDNITKLTRAWCRTHDVGFVRSKLQEPLVKNRKWLEQLKDKAREQLPNIQLMQQRKKGKPVEVTKSHVSSRLSAPRKVATPPPSTPPEKFEIPPARSPPKTTYVPNDDELKLNAMKKQNRLAATELYEEAQKSERICELAKRPERKVEPEVTPPEPKYSRKAVSLEVGKDSKTTGPVTKMTAVTILREGARYLKEEEKELKRIQHILAGGVDEREIEKQYEELREQEERAKLEEIEKKHLQGLISLEEAILAKDDVRKANLLKAEDVKKQSEKLEKILKQWKEKKLASVKQAFEENQKLRENLKHVKEVVINQKQKLASEVNQESTELMNKYIHKKQKELAKRIEMIKEIKVLESLAAVRKRKEVDLTETSGVGLLCEMSVAELKERLFMLRMEAKHEIKERRECLQQERQRQEQVLADTMDVINFHRHLRAEMRLKPKMNKLTVADIRSPELEQLKKELKEKREKRRLLGKL